MKAPDNVTIERRLKKLALSNNGVKSQVKDHAFKLKYLENRAHEAFSFQRDINSRVDYVEENTASSFIEVHDIISQNEKWNVVLTILVGLCLGATIVQYFL